MVCSGAKNCERGNQKFRMLFGTYNKSCRCIIVLFNMIMLLFVAFIKYFLQLFILDKCIFRLKCNKPAIFSCCVFICAFNRGRESEIQEWLCCVAVLPRPQGPTAQPTRRIWRLLLSTSRRPMRLLHSWLQEYPWAGNEASLYQPVTAGTHCQ